MAKDSSAKAAPVAAVPVAPKAAPVAAAEPSLILNAPGAAKNVGPMSEGDEAPVRIFNKNRGSKSFTHEVYADDPHGREAKIYEAVPNSFMTVPKWLADFWTTRFPEDIITGDVAHGEAPDAALQKQLEQLNAEKSALAAELAAAKEELARAKSGQ